MFSKVLALALVASVTAQACDTECCVGDYAPTAVGLGCDAGWTRNPDTGKCYKMGAPVHQWGAARTACETEGAFLVTVNSAAENAWVLSLCGGGNCWIGGNDLSNERSHSVHGWQWHNGESNGYQNFNGGEPNDWNNGEDCIHMKSNGLWNDNGCGIDGNNGGDGPTFAYVCEKVEHTSHCVPDSDMESVLRVRHGASHSQHRCYADASVAQGCTCLCSNTEFDGSECKLGWTRNPDSGKCYKMGGAASQWGAARTGCEAEGAFLVTVNSAAENAWVLNLCGGGNCWIGGNDLSDERSHDVNGWEWHSGESNGYQNFNGGEPNDHSWNNGEDCIHMKSDGLWNDHGCGIAGRNGGDGPTFAYVCEMTPSGTTHTIEWGSTRFGTISDESSDDVPHEVRCCSDVSLPGYKKRTSNCPWAESKIPVCEHASTWADAKAQCQANGARLCTAGELRADCTRGSGCQHDRDQIWSSSSASV